MLSKKMTTGICIYLYCKQFNDVLQRQTGYYNRFSTEVEIRLLISSRAKSKDKDFRSCLHLRSVRAYNQICKPQVVSYASVSAVIKLPVVIKTNVLSNFE